MKGLTATQRLLEAAAAPTIQRIKEDRRHAPPQVRPLLDYLEEHLFEPDLDASRLKRACGIRDNAVPIHFHNALKLPPYAYIEDCRMQTGSQLLLDTSLRIWQIAQLLGYSNLQVFSRAFQRWAGVRPTTFRSRAEAQKPSAAPVANGQRNGRAQHHALSAVTESAPIPMELLRRALHGGLDEGEAIGLFRRLAEIYPSSFQEIIAGGGRNAGRREFDPGRWPTVSLDEYRGIEAVERIRAEEVWNELRDRTEDDQLSLVRQGIRFRTPAFFELLLKKYLEVGRTDRAAGVHVAKLAIETVELIGTDAEERAQLKSRAWANLSNALRLNDDNLGAEEAMLRAVCALPKDPEPRTQAEVLHLRAGLRWSQRRISDALDDQDRAVHLFRALGEKQFLTRGLIMKGFLFQAYGRSRSGIPSLREAIELARQLGDSYLTLSASQTLAWCYSEVGEFAEAAELLPEIRRLCTELDHRFVWVHYRWQEGYIAQGLERLDEAERCFVEAREGFLDLGKSSNAGLASLDLCLLYALQARTAEALSLAASIIPLFEALRYHDEAIVAIQLLEHSVAASEVTQSVLREVRDTMERLRKDPSVKF